MPVSPSPLLSAPPATGATAWVYVSLFPGQPMPPPHSQDTHHPGVSSPLFSVWPQPVRGLVLKAIFSPLSFSPLYLVPDFWILASPCPSSAFSPFGPRFPSLAFFLNPLSSIPLLSSVRSCPLVPSLRFSVPRASSLRPCPCHPAPRLAEVEAGKLRPGQHRPRPRPAVPLTFAAPRGHAGGRRRGRDDPESGGQAGPGGGHGRAAPRSSGSARRPRVARSCLSRTPAGAHAAQPHAGTRARHRPGRGRPRAQPISAGAGGTRSPHRGHRPAARAHARPGRLAPGGVGPVPLVGCTARTRPRYRGQPGDVPEDAHGTHRRFSHSCPCNTSQGTARAFFLVYGPIDNSVVLAVDKSLCLPTSRTGWSPRFREAIQMGVPESWTPCLVWLQASFQHWLSKSGITGPVPQGCGESSVKGPR